jgi:ABC-type multidrug transport system fused ATPase/permease subunit
LLRPYWIWIGLLVALTIAANSFNLVIPQIVASAIDGIGEPDLSLTLTQLAIEFLAVAAGIFVLTYLQSILQTVTSERVARDLRTRLVNKIAQQDFAYVQDASPARLLTNLTSDVDAGDGTAEVLATGRAFIEASDTSVVAGQGSGAIVVDILSRVPSERPSRGPLSHPGSSSSASDLAFLVRLPQPRTSPFWSPL